MLSKHPRKTRQAFTLVELLVVVLILAILMAVALPLYLGAIHNSERGTARANMQTIANANQSFKLKDANHQYTTDIYGQLTADLGPSGVNGPNGRTYTITLGDGSAQCDTVGDSTGNQTIPNGSFSVQSSITTDGCFIPGVSTQ